jgi:hypothetical protein
MSRKARDPEGRRKAKLTVRQEESDVIVIVKKVGCTGKGEAARA